MGKKWAYILSVLFAFCIYVLFQFDAELRRRNNLLRSDVERLQQQVDTFIRQQEQVGSAANIAELASSGDSLRTEFDLFQQRSAKLFELLIGKNELLEKKLKRRVFLEKAKEQSRAKGAPDGFKELK